MKKLLVLMLTLALLMTAVAVPSVAEGEKVIRYGHSYDATTLNPVDCYDDGSYYVLTNICEGLVRGYGNEVYPGVAESWDISEDGMTYTFHLRQSNWSDGTPLTANDFVYTAQYALNPETVYEQTMTYYNLANGEKYYNGECDWEEVGIKALDDYTLEITFEDPGSTYLYNLCSYAWAPVQQAAVEAAGVSYGAEAEGLVTNGPFYCDSWQHESKIVIKKNPYYWDADSVKIDEVDFIVGAYEKTAADMFMAGDLDASEFGGITNINNMQALGLNYYTYASAYNFCHLNCAGHNEEAGRFMGNANFRKALSCAVDRTVIMTIADTSATPAYRIPAPSLTTASGKTWDEEYPYEGWSVHQEPEKAKEYLALALEEIGATIDEVPELTMLCFDSQGNLDKFQAMQDMFLQVLGIHCVITPQPIQQMLAMADSGDFDFWFGGKTVEVPDWLNEVGYEYDSTEMGAVTHFDNAEYNAIRDEAAVELDPVRREELVFEMEKILTDNMSTLLMYWMEAYVMYVPNLVGIVNSNGFGPYFALADFTD